MRGASLERPPSLSRFHRHTHNCYGRNNRAARMLRRGAFRYRLSLLKCILHSMSRYRSYRAPMLIGLVAGAVITYVLMNYVWSMKPWEQAVADFDFREHLLFRATSPDGKWIASIVRDPAIDDRWSCVGCLGRSGEPMSRELFGDSLSIEDPRGYQLKWSADSLHVSLDGGAKP